MKIIFFDIDGTIYSNKIGYITKRVKDSIQLAQKKGYLCIVATGRTYGLIPEEIINMNFDGYICCNGNHIVYHGEDVYVQYLNEEQVCYIMKKFSTLQYDVQTENGSYLFSNDTNLINHYKKSGVNGENIHIVNSKPSNKIMKIEVWMHNSEEKEYILSHAKGFSIEVHSSTNHIELFPYEQTKATGAQWLVSYLNIPFKDTYSFGDSLNDIPLAKLVQYSYAMENGSDELKRIARNTCPSVDEDGVAQILESL